MDWLISKVKPDLVLVARLHKEIGVQIFDIQSGKAIKTLELPEQDRKSLSNPASFTPDGKALIVITENVSMWDLETGKKKSALDPPFKNGAVNPFVQGKKSGDKDVSFAVSPDGSKIAFAVPTSQMGILKLGGDPSPTFGKSHVRVMVFETATGKQLHYAEADLVNRSDANTEQRAIALSADGQCLPSVDAWRSTFGKWGPKNVGGFRGSPRRSQSAGLQPRRQATRFGQRG